jgi:phosphoenolpyruvate-protein phosphotransferase (PTS system enzyme I)
MTAHAPVSLQGVGAAPGVVVGHVRLLTRRVDVAGARQEHIDVSAVDAECARFLSAVKSARTTLERLRNDAGDAGSVVEAHLLMLEDPMLLDGTKRHIEHGLRCAEWALDETVAALKARFERLGVTYFRERKSDLDFVAVQILEAMIGEQSDVTSLVDDEKSVIVAHDVSPADALALAKHHVLAFVTVGGGTTSHTAILARAMGVPCVVACSSVLAHAGNGDVIAVDGHTGRIDLHPDDDRLAQVLEAKRHGELKQQQVRAQSQLPARTTDGHTVRILANVELPRDVTAALAAGAEGVGLYRSEFLFLNRQDVPTEDDHARACDAILDALPRDGTAYLRTFDLGSDKLSAALRIPHEQNPALGLRGVRLGLKRPDAMRAQLRGMIRSITRTGRGSIMLPMIASVDEVHAVRKMIAEETTARIPLGIMIEVPSALFIADELAQVADFFSVGTNDLVQYLLAIDRGNEHVVDLYQPLHPAVLRALFGVVSAAHRAHIPVSLCGSIAAEPAYAPIAVGLGFDTLSMPGVAIAAVKHAIRGLSRAACVALTQRCIEQPTAAAVAALLSKESGGTALLRPVTLE